MDFSERREAEKRAAEVIAEANNVYNQVEEPDDEKEEVIFDQNRCGKGFMYRHYRWMLSDTRCLSKRLANEIANLCRSEALGRVMIGMLRQRFYNVEMGNDGGVKIGEILAKHPALHELGATAEEIYNLPKTEKRYYITLPFEEAGSFDESKILANQAHGKKVAAKIDLNLIQEFITVDSDQFVEWLVHGSLLRHANGIRKWGLYGVDRDVFMVKDTTAKSGLRAGSEIIVPVNARTYLTGSRGDLRLSRQDVYLTSGVSDYWGCHHIPPCDLGVIRYVSNNQPVFAQDQKTFEGINRASKGSKHIQAPRKREHRRRTRGH